MQTKYSGKPIQWSRLDDGTFYHTGKIAGMLIDVFSYADDTSDPRWSLCVKSGVKEDNRILMNIEGKGSGRCARARASRVIRMVAARILKRDRQSHNVTVTDRALIVSINSAGGSMNGLAEAFENMAQVAKVAGSSLQEFAHISRYINRKVPAINQAGKPENVSDSIGEWHKVIESGDFSTYQPLIDSVPVTHDYDYIIDSKIQAELDEEIRRIMAPSMKKSANFNTGDTVQMYTTVRKKSE